MSDKWIDGIPFLGCECNVIIGPNLVNSKIVYRGLTKNGSHIIEWGTGNVGRFSDDITSFSPIKTAEEIERESAISEMESEIDNMFLDGPIKEPMLSENLYNAGYRKQGEVVSYIQVYKKFTIQQYRSSLECFFDNNYIITRKEKS
jgi:hypothetical protein